jgi:hypothetical protein
MMKPVEWPEREMSTAGSSIAIVISRRLLPSSIVIVAAPSCVQTSYIYCDNRTSDIDFDDLETRAWRDEDGMDEEA